MGALRCAGKKQERAERKGFLALAQTRKIDVILVTEVTLWGRLARFAAPTPYVSYFRFRVFCPTTKTH